MECFGWHIILTKINSMKQPIEDVIAKVIDDLFGHRRCSHGTMVPDPDELMLFALVVLERVGVRDPEKDTPWIKQFLARETLLMDEELTTKQDCG